MLRKPRPETQPLQSTVFQRPVKSRGKAVPPVSVHTDDQNTAKLFEEVKAMVRELPERVDERFRSTPKRSPLRRMRRFHPMMFEELLFHPGLREIKGGAPTAWLILISMLRDDFPWLYESGMELYRALRSGSAREIQRSRRQLLDILKVTSRGPFFHELMAPDDKESFFFLRHLDEFVERVVSESRRGDAELVGASPKPTEKPQMT